MTSYSNSVRNEATAEESRRSDDIPNEDYPYEFGESASAGDAGSTDYSEDGTRYRQLADGSRPAGAADDDSLMDELDSMSEDFSSDEFSMEEQTAWGDSTTGQRPMDVNAEIAALESEINEEGFGDFVLPPNLREKFLKRLEEIKKQHAEHRVSADELFEALSELRNDIAPEKEEILGDQGNWADNIAQQGTLLKNQFKAKVETKEFKQKDGEILSAKIDAIVKEVQDGKTSKPQAEAKFAEVIELANKAMGKGFKRKENERKEIIDRVVENLEANAVAPYDGINLLDLGSSNNAFDAFMIQAFQHLVPGGWLVNLSAIDKVEKPDNAKLQTLVQAIVTALKTDEENSDAPPPPPAENGETPSIPVISKWDEVTRILSDLGDESWKYIPIIVGSIAKTTGGDPQETLKMLNVFPPEIRRELMTRANNGQHLDSYTFGYTWQKDDGGWMTPRQAINLLTDSMDKDNRADYLWQDEPEKAPEIANASATPDLDAPMDESF